MKIAVFVNPIKPGIFEFAREVIDRLNALDAEVFTSQKYSNELCNVPVSFKSGINNIIAPCGVVLVIGGDGTIIHFAKHAAKFSKPVLGVNFGRLGFVAGLERTELDKLAQLVSGKYRVQKRSLLDVAVYKNAQKKRFIAFNDAVISKGENTKIIDFSVYLNENEVCSYRADGTILATATGSTAYSLSAGGPIVDPTLDCVLLTPVCPHAMFAKPIVFSNEFPVVLKAVDREDNGIFLNIDGNNVLNLSDCDAVEVTCAKQKVELITFDSRSFGKRLSEKFEVFCK